MRVARENNNRLRHMPKQETFEYCNKNNNERSINKKISGNDRGRYSKS